MTELNTNTAETVAKLVGDNIKPHQLVLEHPTDGIKAPVLVIPTNGGMVIKGLNELFEPYRERPKRRTGAAVLRDAESFITHVNRFKTRASALFADPAKGKPGVKCVYDYHEAVSRTTDGENACASSIDPVADPDWMVHRATYDFPLSPEWTAWQAANGKWMDQAEFALFIEERNEDILPFVPTFQGDLSDADKRLKELVEDLDGTMAHRRDMMALSKGLNITATSKVVNVVGLNSGTGSIVFEEEHNTQDSQGRKVSVPSLFLLGLPVFENATDMYRVVSRLRYKRQGGAIAWKVDLYRTDKVFDHACRDAWKIISEKTGLPLFIGSPENG